MMSDESELEQIREHYRDARLEPMETGHAVYLPNTTVRNGEHCSNHDLLFVPSHLANYGGCGRLFYDPAVEWSTAASSDSTVQLNQTWWAPSYQVQPQGLSWMVQISLYLRGLLQ